MKNTLYLKYIKRLLDIVFSLLFLVLFWWVYIIIAIIVRINLGNPVVFKQPRPGKIDKKTGQEKIFNMYKFRSMTDKRDHEGNLLPDEERLTAFGKALRATSLDETLEIVSILKGDMSWVGPRPQLVRDMVFMTDEQRKRHIIRPGLTGLAQVNGRNAITWEKKLDWDLKYIENISFKNDFAIVIETIKKVFIRSNMTESTEEIDVTLDYGDWLLKEGKVSQEEYQIRQQQADKLLKQST